METACLEEKLELSGHGMTKTLYSPGQTYQKIQQTKEDKALLVKLRNMMTRVKASSVGWDACSLPRPPLTHRSHCFQPVLQGCYRSCARPVSVITDVQRKSHRHNKVQSRITPAGRLQSTQSTCPYELCLADPTRRPF